MDIKNLELSEQDFDLILEGLDAIPEKGIAGEMMMSLFSSIIEDKADPECQHKLKTAQEKRERERKMTVDAKKDDITILKGKLAMLKRWLATQGALRQAHDILGAE